MKKLITMLFVAVLFIGCATTYYDSNGNPISKETMNQLTAEAVNGHLNEHRYRIFVDRMYPNQGPSRYLNNNYGLEVSGDSVGLFLPYWGRLYRAPMGYSDPALHFVQPLQSYDEQPIKDGRRIIMTTRNNSEVIQIIIEQFINASASVSVSSTDRDLIRYTGIMSLDDKFMKKQ